MQRTTQSAITPIRCQNKYSNTKTDSLRSCNCGQHQERMFVDNSSQLATALKLHLAALERFNSTFRGALGKQRLVRISTGLLVFLQKTPGQARLWAQTQGTASRVEFLSPTTAAASQPRAASDRHSPRSAPQAAQHMEMKKVHLSRK